MEVPPFLKSILPVGAMSATVAVNTTSAPVFDGLSELATSVAVLVLTTCPMAELLDPALPLSPA
jgi:hypothetical protein